MESSKVEYYLFFGKKRFHLKKIIEEKYNKRIIPKWKEFFIVRAILFP